MDVAAVNAHEPVNDTLVAAAMLNWPTLTFRPLTDVRITDDVSINCSAFDTWMLEMDVAFSVPLLDATT